MKVKVSTSVGNFNEKITKVWGLEHWKGWNDPDKDVLFFGMYHEFDWNMYHHLPKDFKRTIFWCGSDIIRLVNDVERQRILKLFPVKHYCETKEEAEKLASVGVESEISPSFLEPIEDFPVCYKQSNNPHVWMCAHPEREEEYGILVIEQMASEFPNYTFHIYGVKGDSRLKNVIFHGNIPNEQFNKEIRKYQCGIRLNKNDGNSEVPMKSVLMGQYPITYLPYEKIWNFKLKGELTELLKKLKTMKGPNIEGRKYWIKALNNYPWVERKNK